MGPKDFEWFEKYYPGWHKSYGGYWESYRTLADPAGGHIILQELPGWPPFCQVCQLPCAMPRLDQNEARIVEHEGKKVALCSEGCQWIFENWPQAYASRQQFWERYDGWDLAEVILDLGFVRPDEKTLIGQPTLDLERLWTIDDIRRLKYEIKDPMKAL
jgi:methane monooxygenase component A alpha chain/propane monooxygenase large subunit